MTTARTSLTPLRRLALMAGMLLHLLGATALPALHAWGAPRADTAGAVAHAGQDRPTPDRPAHDELHCVLCHATAAVALPGHGAHLALADPSARPLRVSALGHPASAPASPANARAPPRRS